MKNKQIHLLWGFGSLCILSLTCYGWGPVTHYELTREAASAVQNAPIQPQWGNLTDAWLNRGGLGGVQILPYFLWAHGLQTGQEGSGYKYSYPFDGREPGQLANKFLSKICDNNLDVKKTNVIFGLLVHNAEDGYYQKTATMRCHFSYAGDGINYFNHNLNFFMHARRETYADYYQYIYLMRDIYEVIEDSDDATLAVYLNSEDKRLVESLLEMDRDSIDCKLISLAQACCIKSHEFLTVKNSDIIDHIETDEQIKGQIDRFNNNDRINYVECLRYRDNFIDKYVGFSYTCPSWESLQRDEAKNGNMLEDLLNYLAFSLEEAKTIMNYYK